MKKRKFLSLLLCMAIIFTMYTASANLSELTSDTYTVGEGFIAGVYPYTLANDFVTKFNIDAKLYDADGNSVRSGYVQSGMRLLADGAYYNVTVDDTTVYNPTEKLAAVADGTVLYSKASGTDFNAAETNVMNDYGFISFISGGTATQSNQKAGEIIVKKASADGKAYYEMSSSAISPLYFMGDSAEKYFSRDDLHNGGKYLITSAKITTDNEYGVAGLVHYAFGKFNDTEKNYNFPIMMGELKTDTVYFGQNARALAGGTAETRNGGNWSTYLADKNDRYVYTKNTEYTVEVVEKIPTTWDNTTMELAGIYINGINITGGVTQTLNVLPGYSFNYISRMCIGVGGTVSGDKVTVKISEPKMYIAENPPYDEATADITDAGGYAVEDGAISGICAYTRAATLLGEITVSDGAEKKICTANGSAISDDSFVTDGLRLIVTSSNGATVNEYELSVDTGILTNITEGIGSLANGYVFYDYNLGTINKALPSANDFLSTGVLNTTIFVDETAEQTTFYTLADTILKGTAVTAPNSENGYRLDNNTDYSFGWFGTAMAIPGTSIKGDEYVISYSINPLTYGRFALGHRTGINKTWLDALIDCDSDLLPNIIFEKNGDISIGGALLNTPEKENALKFKIGEYAPFSNYSVQLVMDMPTTKADGLFVKAVYINNEKVFPLTGNGYDDKLVNGKYKINFIEPDATAFNFRCYSFTTEGKDGNVSSVILSDIKSMNTKEFSPVASPLKVEKLDSSELELIGNDVFTQGAVIKNYEGLSVSQLKAQLDTSADAGIIVKQNGVEVTSGDAHKGMELYVVSTGDSSIFLKYTLDDTPDYGKTTFSADTLPSTGTVFMQRTVRLYASENPTVTVVAAAYDVNGNLIDIRLANKTVDGVENKYTATLNCEGVSFVKTFVLNFETLQPLTGISLLNATGGTDDAKTNY